METRSLGELLVGLQGTAPDGLAELWVSVTHVVIESESESLDVFPPAGDPEAVKRVDLLSSRTELSLVTVAEVPADRYDRVTLRFDGVFARRGREVLQVVPDSGNLKATFSSDTPLLVDSSRLATVVLELNLGLSTRSDSATFDLDPQLEAAAPPTDDRTELGQFRGVVRTVNDKQSIMGIDVTTQQISGRVAVVGQLDVQLDDQTLFHSEELGGVDISFLEVGDEIEVESVLYQDLIRAVELEIRTPDSFEDLNDNGTEDVLEYPDHDTDVDNDGVPNVLDVDYVGPTDDRTAPAAPESDTNDREAKTGNNGAEGGVPTDPAPQEPVDEEVIPGRWRPVFERNFRDFDVWTVRRSPSKTKAAKVSVIDSNHLRCSVEYPAHRAEIAPQDSLEPSRPIRLPLDTDLVLEWSCRLAPDWETDTDKTLIAQILGDPDESEQSRPAFTLIDTHINGRDVFIARLRGTEEPLGTGKADDVVVAPALRPGVWYHWRLETLLSWRSEGYSRLFRNGKKLYDVKRRTAFNDQALPFFKYGLYRPTLKAERSSAPEQTIELRPVRIYMRGN